MAAIVRRDALLATPTLRLNFGCGQYPISGWLNVDEDQSSLAEVFDHVPPIDLDDNAVAEIYAGHFLEHLTPADAAAFLQEAYRVLEPGGRLGIMVPDMAEVMRRYVMGAAAPMEFPAGQWRDLNDLDEMCDVVIFSTAQQSPHRWAYDQYTLTRLLQRHGFVVDGEFDRFHDPRVAVGAWYQFGYDAHKPGEPPKAERDD